MLNLARSRDLYNLIRSLTVVRATGAKELGYNCDITIMELS